MPLIVLLDASVLYPAELRSFLMYLAVADVFRAKWSAQIHEEWISSLLLKRSDLSRAKLERTRELMDRHAPDALVTGYEDLIAQLELPDPNDQHVLAVASRCNADVILTNNLQDFPAAKLQEYEIEAQAPDEFIQRLIVLFPADVLRAAEEHRLSMRNPERTVEEYLTTLERQGLVATVKAMRLLWSGA